MTEAPLPPPVLGLESEESRVYPLDTDPPLWDDIQCGQEDDIAFMDLLNLDLNQ